MIKQLKDAKEKSDELINAWRREQTKQQKGEVMSKAVDRLIKEVLALATPMPRFSYDFNHIPQLVKIAKCLKVAVEAMENREYGWFNRQLEALEEIETIAKGE